MKFKLKNIVLVSLLAVAGIFGAGAAVFSKNINETPVAEKAEAASTSYVYLNPDVWSADKARFAVYFYGNGNPTWVSMSGSGTKYYAAVPSGYPNCIFCRMNPGTTVNNWDNKWNQSDNLSVPSNSLNYYTISGWGDTTSPGSWGAGLASNIYLRGSMNNWGVDESYCFSRSGSAGGSFTFTLSKELRLSQTFKIGDNSWDWSVGSNDEGTDKKTIGGVEGNSRLGGEDGNIKVDVPGTYNFSITVNFGGTWKCNSVSFSALGISITFDKEGGSGGSDSTTVYYASAMTSGLTAPSRSGYYFDGYYDGDNGTGTKYYNHDMTSAKNWDKDPEGKTATLYAKWYVEKVVYFISEQTDGRYESAYKIYGWNGTGDSSYNKQFGDYPGTLISAAGSSQHLSVINYKGSYHKMYRIVIHTDNFLIYKDESNHSSDVTSITDGAAYSWSGTNGTACTSSSTDGAAINCMYRVESARDAVAEDVEKGIKQYSICGITNASELLLIYNNLDETPKGYVDSSFTRTYVGPSYETEGNVYFSDIFNELRKMSSGSKGVSFGLNNIFGSEDNLSTIIIIVSSSVALLSVTALSILVIRKRKSKEQ